MGWIFWVWNKFNMFKYVFICWLFMWNRLKIKDRFYKYGIGEDNKCVICGIEFEIIVYFFFECKYGKVCVESIL